MLVEECSSRATLVVAREPASIFQVSP